MTALAKDQRPAAPTKSFFVPLSKIDPDQRMVYGYASTEALDAEGETITVDALKAALPAYMRFSNLREMHQLSAIGTTKQAKVDEKGLYIGGKIVDNAAWEKIKAGVYKGFSVGGNVTARDPVDESRITGLDLVEISAVDRPCNPECLIDLWKASRDPGNPKQKWDCGVIGHDHLQKADAVQCMQKRASAGPGSDEMRARLFKAVGDLDDAGVAAAVAAFEKASKPEAGGEEEAAESADSAETEDTGEADEAAVPDEAKEPKAGDKVAFVNDAYTTKGPSGGVISRVEDGVVFIDHADVKNDEFVWDDLNEPVLRRNDAGDRIWLIKTAADDIIGQPSGCLISVFAKGGDSIYKVTTGRWEVREKAPDPVAKKAPPASTPSNTTGDYGPDADAGYADPGYVGKARLPLKEAGVLSPKRIKAAWAYISRADNPNGYTDDHLALIKASVTKAWKDAISPDGPTGAAKASTPHKEQTAMPTRDALLEKLGNPDAKGSFKKGLVAAASAIHILESLSDLTRRLKIESAVEGDASDLPTRMMSVMEMFSDVCQSLLEEEVGEMLANKEIGDIAMSTSLIATSPIYYAQGVVDLAKGAKARGDALNKRLADTIGDRTGEPNYENLLKAFGALVQKGQDEWDASRPPDNQGTGDSWTAPTPKDNQGAGDRWPAEMVKAAQVVHDNAVRMGATCTAHKAAKADEPPADADEGGDGKKNPPPPPPVKNDAKDSKDSGKKTDDAEEADEEAESEGEASEDEDKEAARSNSKSKAAKPDALSVVMKRLDTLSDVLESLSKGGRNPPRPMGRTSAIGKSEDHPFASANLSDGETDELAKAYADPKNATDKQRALALKAVRANPNFLPRG